MSDDWKPGDLAMLVRSGRVPCPVLHAFVHTGRSCPPPGAVREVAETYRSACGCPALRFSDGTAAAALRCKKLRPHAPDEEDAETIRLLNGKPVRAPKEGTVA